jgi:membrane protein
VLQGREGRTILNLPARIRKYVQEDLWTARLDAGSRAGLAPVAVLRILVVTAWTFEAHALTLRAASLVYTTLLSLVPFLAVAFSVLKAFGAHKQAEPLIGDLLAPLGPASAEVAEQVIGFISNVKVGVLGAVGLAGLFYTVISLIEKVEDAFNQIWRVRRSRPLVRKFTDYLSIVLVGPVLVVTALGLIATGQSSWVVQRVVETVPFGGLLVTLVGKVMPFLFLTTAFTFLYRVIPYTRVPLASALIGGASAALLWELAGTAFAAFIATSARYAAIYSGFAVIVLFLIWLYVGWLVVLAGAAVAHAHQTPFAYLASRQRQSHLFREQAALGLLVEVARRHLSGQPPARLAELPRALALPVATVDDLVDELIRAGILLRSAEPEGVALARAPELVQVAGVLGLLRDPTGVVARLPEDGRDPVGCVLRRRDDAVREALDGLTLRDLAPTAPRDEGDRPPGRAAWLPLVVAGSLALGQGTPAAALTGTEWRHLPPPARDAYVTGVIDTWRGVVAVQESVGGHDPGITVFAGVVACLRERLIAPAQVVASVERYTEENPGLRGKDMPDIVFAALGPLCR